MRFPHFSLAKNHNSFDNRMKIRKPLVMAFNEWFMVLYSPSGMFMWVAQIRTFVKCSKAEQQESRIPVVRYFLLFLILEVWQTKGSCFDILIFKVWNNIVLSETVEEDHHSNQVCIRCV